MKRFRSSQGMIMGCNCSKCYWLVQNELCDVLARTYGTTSCRHARCLPVELTAKWFPPQLPQAVHKVVLHKYIATNIAQFRHGDKSLLLHPSLAWYRLCRQSSTSHVAVVIFGSPLGEAIHISLPTLYLYLYRVGI